MEEKRLQLSETLHKILGNENVYFQPPEGTMMDYPAIVYTRDGIRNTPADNQVYLQSQMYQITVIDEDPDSELVEKVSKLPTARFIRHFTSDNLNHDVFTMNI